MVNIAATNSTNIPLLPSEKAIGNLELVTLFDEPMPIGVVVCKKGRIFISYPRLVDDIDFTVAELKQPNQRNGHRVCYPNAEIHRQDGAPPSERLLSVQGMTLDARDRLWLLDHAKIKQNPVPAGAPKLVGVDLETNQTFQKIIFPEAIASAKSTLWARFTGKTVCAISLQN
ncbi:major royal jelly protein [Tolypothrix sp. NIES-4075]|uniref:L-dopachrome tautomerase-related protein n=1 Tax=Tolypothrix sp. NIES-4075 TaxID=2005459 RepID=UPI000B5C8336|nr:L-dopachrome tautomerase-related protein [Tolypothrix sp. NIES-4075]GAX44103.1 major royal jelly protein [Tolypothrix sp. NIES-4075]